MRRTARIAAIAIVTAGVMLACLPAIGRGDASVNPWDPPAESETIPPSDRPPPGPAEPPLAFESELIRLTVRSDSLEVDGLYRFACQPSAARYTALLFPFPRDSLLGGARMVSLAGRLPQGDWRPLRFTELYPPGSGALWRIPLAEGPRYEVRAIYRQALLADYGRYIVTTTQTWSAPLEQARFEIVLPDGAEPTDFSYPFECVEIDGSIIYVYEAEHFEGERDIVFTWSR